MDEPGCDAPKGRIPRSLDEFSTLFESAFAEEKRKRHSRSNRKSDRPIQTRDRKSADAMATLLAVAKIYLQQEEGGPNKWVGSDFLAEDLISIDDFENRETIGYRIKRGNKALRVFFDAERIHSLGYKLIIENDAGYGITRKDEHDNIIQQFRIRIDEFPSLGIHRLSLCSTSDLPYGYLQSFLNDLIRGGDDAFEKSLRQKQIWWSLEESGEWPVRMVHFSKDNQPADVQLDPRAVCRTFGDWNDAGRTAVALLLLGFPRTEIAERLRFHQRRIGRNIARFQKSYGYWKDRFAKRK